MSRPGIDRLPKPPRKYQIKAGVLDDGSWFAFETLTEARSEDETREKLLSPLMSKERKLSHQWRRSEIKGLIENIKSGSTPASSAFMRKHRKRVGGNLWQLMDRETDDLRFFTLLPGKWIYPAGSLSEADARKLFELLRQALRRKGASEASGWLFAFLDGEYDPTFNTFRLHVHGIVAGGMIDVVKRLKKTKNFQRVCGSEQTAPVHQPIRLQKICKTPQRLVTYLMKGFWCKRAMFEDRDGTKKKAKKKARINHLQPFAEHLLWLNRWRLQDLALSMGMSVTASGFKIRKKCTPTKR